MLVIDLCGFYAASLQDVSSVLTQQQIARNWRGHYDLLVRSPSSVSQPERDAGWIDPLGALESYGGISSQQVESILHLAHVVQVIPFAMVGWQPVNILLPVALRPNTSHLTLNTVRGGGKLASALLVT